MTRLFSTAFWGDIFWQQKSHLTDWAPVSFAVSIGVYFGLASEPSPVLLLGGIGLNLLALYMCKNWDSAYKMAIAAPLLVIFGVGWANVSALYKASAVLKYHYYGPIEGRIVGVDRSASDALRLTLDRVVLRRLAPKQTPERIRVSLHGALFDFKPVPGETIMLMGHLSPPAGAVEPSGFDFRRYAWFLRLGGLGYSRTPVVVLTPAGSALALARVRMRISTRIQAALPGQLGAFAATLLSGDRSGLNSQTLQILRQTNLAHLLAISGLHMGLLTGFIFTVLRLAVLFLPGSARHWPAKKIAACGAILAGAFYLALSGGNVATERAFVMVLVGFGALFFDKRALSLRSVSVAASLVLLLRPSALLGPGFQMSFAATLALITVYTIWRQKRWQPGPKWSQPIWMVVMSSLVAGLATAPIAAAHFNMVSQYGLLANLISVPLMGLVIMPAGVIGVMLMPLELESGALWVMGQGLAWILGVADWVAGFKDAVRYIKAPAPVVLPLLAASALFLGLWIGRLRVIGVIGCLLGFLIWVQTPRPLLLISDNGALLGILAPQGRLLSKSKGAGFVAKNWLRNDGDGRSQVQAAQGWQLAFGDMEWLHILGKKAAASITDCRSDQVVIANVKLQARGDCLILDAAVFSATGSMDIIARDGGLQVRTAHSYSGNRLWSRQHLTQSEVVALAQKIDRFTVLLNSSGSIPPSVPEP